MNQAYGKRHGKACSPNETVLAIQGILSKLGIIVLQEWNSAMKGSYSVLLRVKGTNLYSNGKGVAEEYALASGYAELMERLQTMALFRFHCEYSEEVMHHAGYLYTPDEVKVAPEEIAENESKYVLPVNVAAGNEKLAILKDWLKIENSQMATDKPAEYIYTIPFMNIENDERKYIPVKMLDLLCGSNGMCAGNQYEEAMVQGLSEVCERYVNKIIIRECLTPPTIDMEYIKANCPISYQMIQSIDSQYYKVIVKDCSLQKKYPVAAVICIDTRSAKYFVKFGAQPHLDIAIERCMTEMFQGRNLKNTEWLKEFFYSYDQDFVEKNLSNILHTGDGYYPYEFFMESSEKFDAWYYEGNDNKVFMEQLINLIQNNGYSIYVRDWSFLSFPTYQIVVPGFSNLYDAIEERIEWHCMYHEARENVKHIDQLSPKEFNKIIKFMELNRYDNRFGILELIGIPVNRNSKWSTLKKDYFQALYYYGEVEYEKAYSCINTYAQQNNNVVSRCLRHIMALRVKKVDEREIFASLNDFYSKDIINYVKYLLDKNYLKQFHIDCFQCSKCEEPDCYQKEIDLLLMKLKEVYKEVHQA